MLDLTDGVHQVAQLADLQFLVVDAARLVGDLLGDVRHHASSLEVCEVLRHRAALVETLQADLGHLEPLQQAGNLVSRGSAHALDVAVAQHAAQVLDLLVHVFLDPQRLGRELVLVELRTLGADQRLLAVGTVSLHQFFHWLSDSVGALNAISVACSPGLGSNKLIRTHFADGHVRDHVGGNLLGCFEHDAHGLRRLGNVPQLHGHKSSAGLVVKRLLHLGLESGGCVHVTEPPQHLSVRAFGNRFLHGLGGEQGADHFVAAAVAERLGDNIGVQPVAAEHPVLARPERGDVRAHVRRHGHPRGADRLDAFGRRHAGVHGADLLDVQAVRSFNLHLGPVRVNEPTVAQVGHGPVHGFHLDGSGHLGGDFLALGFMLLLKVAQDACACVPEPLKLPHAGGVQVGDGSVRSLLLHGLIRGPLGVFHAALGLRLEQTLHATDGFLPLDLLL